MKGRGSQPRPAKAAVDDPPARESTGNPATKKLTADEVVEKLVEAMSVEATPITQIARNPRFSFFKSEGREWELPVIKCGPAPGRHSAGELDALIQQERKTYLHHKDGDSR